MLTLKKYTQTTAGLVNYKSTLIYIGNALSGHRIAPTSADILPGLMRAEGYSVFVASSFRNITLRLAHMLYTILANLRSADAVIIDVYSTRNFWYAYLCACLARFLSIPYIPVLHGGDFPKRMDASPGTVSALLAGAFRIVVPSGYLAMELTSRGFNAQLIPNAIPVSDYPFTPRSVSRPRLLYVRAFAKLYQPQTALRVLARLRRRYPDATLCMVGADKDGTQAECRRLASELGLGESVCFTGMLDKPAWHALSSDYSIFINTTSKDNMPVSVIEAMALGLPVVSTNPGGIPYLISSGYDGLLVDVGDDEGMAEAVVRLVEDPGLSLAMSLRARQKAESFDWDRVKVQWHTLLDALQKTNEARQ